MRWILQLFIQDHSWKLFFVKRKKKQPQILSSLQSGEMIDDIFFFSRMISLSLQSENKTEQTIYKLTESSEIAASQSWKRAVFQLMIR